MATATDHGPASAAGVWRVVATVIVTVAAAVGGGLAGRHAASASATASVTASASARPGAAYLAIAEAGNTRLDRDFDRLHGSDRADLAAAEADLRDIAATERLFDRRLAGLALPPGSESWARTLIDVNEARATLTAQAAGSMSLAQLAGYQQRLTSANVPVERAVRAIRADLGLPAPDTD